MITTQIPQQLQDLKQWHMWKDVDGTKVPIRIGGQPAKSNDPTTWCSFEAAVESAQYYSGLAFEITEPYCGVDLDNCLNADGDLKAWAVPIVNRFLGVAYAEISPSGTGVKFLTLARKTAGARCVHKIGEDKQQVECYDHARSWCMTGDVFMDQDTIADGANAVHWLCREYLAPTMTVRAPLPPVFAGHSLRTPLIERATTYVDNVEQAGSGGRNNAAFSLGGHLAAMADDLGNRLDGDQIAMLMRIWNSRNAEPLDDEELARAASSSGRNGTARETKNPIVLPVLDDDVDLSGILGTRALTAGIVVLPEGSKVERVEYGSTPEAVGLQVPGLIGDLVEHNLRTAHYPLPELALASALGLMSTLTGGKIQYRGSRSNLYVMGLAPSGAGKDHGRKLNRKILRRAGHGNACGPERIGSHAGIVSAMAENWNTLFQIDEIARLISTMQSAQGSPHLYNIASVLMQIYSSADDVWQGDAYGDRKKVKTLEYPHCVVYGTSVPEGFWESLSPENMKDGLIGRFLVFENSAYVDYQDPPTDTAIPESIIDRARHWLDLKTHDGNLAGVTNHDGANPLAITADAAATERLTSHAIEISERRKSEEPSTAAIWSRHAEKTNKIAMLFAASRYCPAGEWPVISVEDADKAVRLNNWLTRRMLARAGAHISENQTERDHLKVLRLIQSGDEWTGTQLAKAMRWLKARERREILLTLQESGDIVAEEVPTGGRTMVIYRALNRGVQ